MSILPPELVYNILSLDTLTLHSCSLVSLLFYTAAQDLLFTHLKLGWNADSFKRQCEVFLEEENHHITNRIKKLTIHLGFFWKFHDDSILTPLVALAVKLAPQIEMLRLDGRCEGVRSPLRWHFLPPTLLDCVYKHVMPFLLHLELEQIDQAPLFAILQNCPQLRHVHLSSSIGIFTPVEEEKSALCSLAQISSLTIGEFNLEDFTPEYGLTTFIELAGRNITSFHLISCNQFYLQRSLSILSLLPTLMENISHLSLGLGWFNQMGGFALITLHLFVLKRCFGDLKHFLYQSSSHDLFPCFSSGYASRSKVQSKDLQLKHSP
ncbi:hypothetical protein DL96DRAFT_1810874 [Flagelloscypha sp. PMI_526]|nr:hypothetical protein DL96DRAFT_1810874 [Flagelloscypha sp. PMI_526]